MIVPGLKVLHLVRNELGFLREALAGVIHNVCGIGRLN